MQRIRLSSASVLRISYAAYSFYSSHRASFLFRTVGVDMASKVKEHVLQPSIDHSEIKGHWRGSNG